MQRTQKLPSPVLLIGLSLFLTALGCLSTWQIRFLKVKEVMEGSDDLIREITQGMDIAVEKPLGTVPLNQPWEVEIRISHNGPYKPHLNLVMIQVWKGPPEGVSCRLLEPETRRTERSNDILLIYMKPIRITPGSTVILRIECTMEKPGTYRIYTHGTFRESSLPFFEAVIDLEAR